MSRVRIEFSQEELEAICRRRAVKRLALFGSVVRDDFGPDSDVDVLVEFRDDFEGKQVYKIYDELTELFGGRKIDLVEVDFVNRRIREQILSEAQDVFAA
jgi:predicted nucleotidyltransferase